MTTRADERQAQRALLECILAQQESDPAFFLRWCPSAFVKHPVGSEARLAAMPYVCECYGPSEGAACLPKELLPRARPAHRLFGIVAHTIPGDGLVWWLRLVLCVVALTAWWWLYPMGLKLRGLICAGLYSCTELTFTQLERGRSYTSLAQFLTVVLYTPVLLEAYPALVAVASDHAATNGLLGFAAPEQLPFSLATHVLTTEAHVLPVPPLRPKQDVAAAQPSEADDASQRAELPPWWR